MQPFQAHPHEAHTRLTRFLLSAEPTRRFFDCCKRFDTQSLQYVPFQRFVVARYFLNEFGDDISTEIQEILHDRRRGGLVVSPAIEIVNTDQCLQLATAVSHLIGIPSFDSMTGA